jgi:hypothetical protein
MKRTLCLIAIVMLCILMIPAIEPVLAVSGTPHIVTVGSIDPALGYDTIINGTTIFHVARHVRPVEGVFYHNVAEDETEMLNLQSSTLTVPDPAGRVTVWSNMVFLGTGWNAKSKSVVHPDGTSQSILHVSGQANGDPYARYLVVTIYNSKYPSGYQLDYSVVAGSFDNSYDVKNIVSQRDVNTVSVAVTTWVGYWNVQSYFQVSTVGTDVYILMISGVPTSYVNDMDAVRRGVEASCMVEPLVHLNTWKPLTYLEIRDMATYQYIITYPDNVRPPNVYPYNGIIVVNAHGEVLPVPPGQTWQAWISLLNYQTRLKGLVWSEVAGYPFFYYGFGQGDQTMIGEQGFQLFLNPQSGASAVDCWPDSEGSTVPLQGGYSNRLWGYNLMNGGLHEGRPIAISKSAPANKDAWTEQLSSSDGSWSGDVSVEYDSSKHTRGSSSIKIHVGWWGANSSFTFTFNSGKEVDMTQYPFFAIDMYLDGGGIANADTGDESVILRDTSGKAARKDFHQVQSGKFVTLSVTDPSGWTAESGFDFQHIKSIRIDRYMTMWHGDDYAWVDGMFFDNGAVNIPDVLDVMYRGPDSNGVKYLTLGLMGLYGANENMTSTAIAGYYVHNGAEWYDDDYLKGKYTMATAAWSKISVLAISPWTDVTFWQPPLGPTYYSGKVRTQITWTAAIPPQTGGGNWKVDFVTTTLAYAVNYISASQWSLSDANAPLRIPSASGTTFAFQRTYSTILVDKAEGEFQRVVGEGIFWTAVGVFLAPFTEGLSAVAATVALGIVQTGVDAYLTTYKSGGIEDGTHGFVDLAMRDFSKVGLDGGGGSVYSQLQSYGYTEVGLPPSGAGAYGTLTFELGQKCGYYNGIVGGTDWFQGITQQTIAVVVEPRQSGDSNQIPQKPPVPNGPTQGFKNTLYTFSATATDPDGDDVRILFNWGDGTSTTGWIESGNVVFATHQWSNYNNPWPVQVQAQDPNGANQGSWSALSDPLNIAIVPKLVISTNGGGTTNPAPGTYAYSYGSWVQVTETPYANYAFNYWILDGSYIYTTTVNVQMTNDHSLTAYFYYTGGGGGGGGGCPTLFTWNGSAYVDYGVINIHNPSGEDIIRTVPIKTTDLAINKRTASIHLREGWPGLNFSESVIDQVQLYAIDNSGKQILCPLVSAQHSRLGNVLPQLLYSDDTRVQSFLLETIDAQFLIPNRNIRGFVFVIEGCNMYKM